MDDEKLISLVKNFENIYNKQAPGFKSAEKKRETWLNISNQLGVPAEVCMKRWTSLRDQYTRECREKTTTGKRWHLSESMSFLKPHIRFRPRLCSKLPWEPDLIHSDTTCEELTEFVVPLSPGIAPKFENFQESSSVDFEEPCIYIKEPDTKKRKINDVDKAFCEAVNCFKQVCERKTKHTTAIEGFGQMIMATISEMSEAKQCKAMRLITELAMKIKEEPE